MNFTFKLNIARSKEEAKEQTKTGKAIITTEITGGDIDPKELKKMQNVLIRKKCRKINKTAETESNKLKKISKNLEKEEIKDKVIKTKDKED